MHANDSNRFMANGQAGADRIFAFQDVNVGAADRRGGDPHQASSGPAAGMGFSSSTIRPRST